MLEKFIDITILIYESINLFLEVGVAFPHNCRERMRKANAMCVKVDMVIYTKKDEQARIVFVLLVSSKEEIYQS